MKLIKSIKLHRKLRKRQELLCDDCVLWSQSETRYLTYPKLNEFSSVNRGVEKVEKKLPNLYFFLSDLFGYYKSLKNE